MKYKQYLSTFYEASGQLDKSLLQQKQLELSVGEVLNSVFLKLYKKSWTDDPSNPLNAKTRIFFSVWISDLALKEQKLFYNIHAFKLRHLKGYTIQSRHFAEIFRKGFKKHEKNWPNVSVQFGPLTLMEGWVKTDPTHFQDEIVALANKFIGMEDLVDNTLAAFK